MTFLCETRLNDTVILPDNYLNDEYIFLICNNKIYNDNDYNGGTHNLQRSLYGRRRVSIASDEYLNLRINLTTQNMVVLAFTTNIHSS